jgi:hypothetical protein
VVALNPTHELDSMNTQQTPLWAISHRMIVQQMHHKYHALLAHLAVRVSQLLTVSKAISVAIHLAKSCCPFEACCLEVL